MIFVKDCGNDMFLKANGPGIFIPGPLTFKNKMQIISMNYKNIL